MITQQAMTAALAERPELIDLEPFEWTLDRAIDDIAALVAKSPPGSKGRDYYETWDHAMRAVRLAVQETVLLRQAYERTCRRVDLLEMIIMQGKDKGLVTHEIMDALKGKQL